MQTPTWIPLSDKGLNSMFAASRRSNASLYGIQSLSANDLGFEESSLGGEEAAEEKRRKDKENAGLVKSNMKGEERRRRKRVKVWY
ncbi:hypothetical protein E2C01_066991 [Portunus trituberculatus]|uniref:Uncharacterized protein n=1 Tax=Portunus trituberculatus TaxID=210409 RepID=A0A5B7HSE7_PORTR|nr:hypothetical protein [Portunus trituberculatus]